MATYSAYGLTIASDLPFPELPARDSPPDLIVRRSAIELPEWMERSERRARAEEETAYLFCRRRGALRIHRGREVLVEPAAGADEPIVRNWVLGQGFGVAMFQRGFLVLHASVVNCDDAGIAFVGGSGAGKSTLAMAFCGRGDYLLEDDHAVVAEGATPMVLPGTPQIRLSENAPQSFGGAVGPVACARVSEEKLGWDFRHRFHAEPVPLRWVFVISDGDEYRTVPLTEIEAGAELARHSFLSSLLVRPESAVRHERRCRRLAGHVSVRRLERPRSLVDVPRLVGVVREAMEAVEVCA
jgi:hypothetical protein